MSKPKVSIIVPLFNRANLIRETVESVLNQTEQSWELLIVDDHSSDDSFEVAEQFSQKDSRIRCWQRKSELKGAPTCRNEGLRQSQGEYVIFLDSDDLLAPTCIENRLKVAGDHPHSLPVFTTAYFQTQPGDLDKNWFFVPDDGDDLLTAFLHKPLWSPTSVFWPRDEVIKLGGFKEGLPSWQDWELHVRALILKVPFRMHAIEPDNFCRRSPNVVTIGKKSNSSLHLAARVRLLNDIRELLQSEELDSASNRAGVIHLLSQIATQYVLAGEYQEAKEISRSIESWGYLDSLQARQWLDEACIRAKQIRAKRFWRFQYFRDLIKKILTRDAS